MLRKRKNKSSFRVSIISAVNTYLGFFVLIVLVVEASLGAVALKADSQNQLIAIIGMILVFVGLISVVSFFAYRKPGVLLRPISSQQKLQEFCRSISGHWWQRVTPDKPCALSYIEVSPDLATNTVKLKGRAFSKEGKLSATFESVVSCINLNEQKIFYYWKGIHISDKNEQYKGFGEVTFTDPIGQRGNGVFSDTKITDEKSTTRMSTKYWRSEKDEDKVMQGHDDNLISDLVKKIVGNIG